MKMQQDTQSRKERGQTYPKVAIVVLNWNNYTATSRLLKSLHGLTYPNYVTYLVDNYSKDGSRERLYEEFKKSRIKFIFNEANLGFAAGCNRGIKKALDDECDYVLLLNNDCIVYDKSFLNYGVELAETDSRIGIVTGKILYWPDTKRIASAGGHKTFCSGEKYIGHGEIDEGQYDKIAEVRFASGALMLVKREVFDRIGLLPEVYFFGKEDWEFSMRARKAKFRLLYHPKFSVYHEEGSSYDQKDPTYVYNGTLNKILYKRRNSTQLFFALWFFFYKIYLKYLFPIKYHLQQNKYVQLPPNILHETMLNAVKDAPFIEKITEEILIRYRRTHLHSAPKIQTKS